MGINLNILVSTQRNLVSSPINEIDMESHEYGVSFSTTLVNTISRTFVEMPIMAAGEKVVLRSTVGTIVYPPAGATINNSPSYFLSASNTATFTSFGPTVIKAT